MNLRIAVVLVLLIVCQGPIAADVSNDVDELSVARVFERLSEAWRAGDGNAWADEFVCDADFTVWFGFGMKGQEDIAQGHQFIFDGIYAQTILDVDVRQIRIMSENVAVVHLGISVIKEGKESPGVPDVVPMAVLERTDTSWKIVAFQNTPNLEGPIGDIRQFKKALADSNQAQ